MSHENKRLILERGKRNIFRSRFQRRVCHFKGGYSKKARARVLQVGIQSIAAALWKEGLNSSTSREGAPGRLVGIHLRFHYFPFSLSHSKSLTSQETFSVTDRGKAFLIFWKATVPFSWKWSLSKRFHWVFNTFCGLLTVEIHWFIFFSPLLGLQTRNVLSPWKSWHNKLWDGEVFNPNRLCPHAIISAIKSIKWRF